ncbi:putative invertase inhibitor [Papaver somniferum]|uniref:putative invertase inhibitor n=1 Tax=Papaver somniferum TaxID=3469 RepID=UPI000E6FBD04|nr:putative invertase inhibitor [Papaver somniferum]
MELSLKNATYIHTYIEGILKDVKQEPRTRMCLKDCMEFYSTAVEDLQEAMEAFNGKDYYNALRLVSDAGIYADTCKTGFTEFGVDFNLLRKQDYDFYQLTDISLDIIAKISDSKV